MQKGISSEPLDLQLVVPVYNEEKALHPCITSLQETLRKMPWKSEIVIVDNASTDSTFNVAVEETMRHENVRVIRLSEKGRGRALRAAWSRSDAAVLAYTDVDLSTDLDALPELVRKVAQKECDLAIGSRLLPDSRVKRGAKREFISRGYNKILRFALGARFHDAQCGFKAISQPAAAQLLAEVEDDNWFFDTELLIKAQRKDLVVHELPVVWVEDTDSRVTLVSTIREDLRGVARLMQGRQRVLVPAVRIFAAVLALFTSPASSPAPQMALASPDQ